MELEGHMIGKNREACYRCRGVTQLIIMLVSNDDAFHALTVRGDVHSYPSHIPRNLSDYAVGGTATLQFDNDQRIR
jgi:hypothetical protein